METLKISKAHITNDIVIVLKVSYNEADKLKKQLKQAGGNIILGLDDIMNKSLNGSIISLKST